MDPPVHPPHRRMHQNQRYITLFHVVWGSSLGDVGQAQWLKSHEQEPRAITVSFSITEEQRSKGLKVVFMCDLRLFRFWLSPLTSCLALASGRLNIWRRVRSDSFLGHGSGQNPEAPPQPSRQTGPCLDHYLKYLRLFGKKGGCIRHAIMCIAAMQAHSSSVALAKG